MALPGEPPVPAEPVPAFPTPAWPDLAVLELLVAVEDHGSLAAAARAVGMAQPNASRAVARLEKTWGVVLLERRTAGSRLSAAGLAVAGPSRSLVEDARTLVRAVRELGAERNTRLAVAASRTVAEYLLPGWLAALRQVRPALRVQLSVDNSRHVFDQLATGSADLGFVESPGVPAGFHRLVVARDRLAVVVAPGHPWAGAGPVTPGQLAATPLVVREPGSGTRVTLDRLLKAFEPVAPTLELESNAAVRIAVAAGAGPAVLSDLAVRPALAAGELVEVPVSGLRLERRMRAVWKGPRVPTGPVAALVAIARERGSGRP